MQAPKTSRRPRALPSRTHRLLGIDAGRVLATFGIVWVHTSEVQGLAPKCAALGRFGTSFYIVAAVLMSSRPFFLGAAPQRAVFLRKRAARLLVPFLVWSAIYAAFYLVTMLPQGYSAAEIARFWGPFAGTAPHLWFLPFAFLIALGCILIMPLLLRQSRMTLALLVTLATPTAYLLTYWALPQLNHDWIGRLHLVRLSRYLEEFPLAVAAILGVALYGSALVALELLGRRRRRVIAVSCGLGFLGVQVAYYFLLEPLRSVFWTEVRLFANVAGALLLVLCVAERNSALIRRIAPLGQATYFTFLCHQLLLDVSKKTLRFAPGHGSLWFAFATSCALFGLSLALGTFVRSRRWLHWLIP